MQLSIVCWPLTVVTVLAYTRDDNDLQLRLVERREHRLQL